MKTNNNNNNKLLKIINKQSKYIEQLKAKLSATGNNQLDYKEEVVISTSDKDKIIISESQNNNNALYQKITELNLPNIIDNNKLESSKTKKNTKNMQKTDYNPLNKYHLMSVLDLSNLSNNSFDKNIFNNLCLRISDMKNLSTIILRNNYISDDIIDDLTVVISYKYLKKLDISYNNIGPNGGKKIVKAFIDNNINLSWIDISNNNFSNDSNTITSFVNYFKSNGKNLNHIGISYNGNTAVSPVDSLIKHMNNSNNIVHSLVIKNSKLGDVFFNNLNKILSNNRIKFKSLTLSNCHISEKSLINMSKALSNNINLVYLDLSRNYVIGVSSFTKFVEFLRKNIYLNYFYLQNNKLNDVFCERLCDVLCNNNIISVCDISNNNLTSESYNYITKLLEHNNTIQYMGDLGETTKIGILNSNKILEKMHYATTKEYKLYKPIYKSNANNNTPFNNYEIWNY